MGRRALAGPPKAEASAGVGPRRALRAALKQWRKLSQIKIATVIPGGLVTQLVTHPYTRGHIRLADIASELVGVAGFEPPASSSRTKRAAKLRYTPPVRNLTGTARDFDSLAETQDLLVHGCDKSRPGGEPSRHRAAPG